MRPVDALEGTVIGSYRVVGKIGEGGMGAVYVGEHALIGRKAAIKVLHPQMSANPEIIERFFNEARAATAIADLGIVQIFDFGYHTDGSAYIVMEFLAGESLDARLRREGRMAPVDAIRIIRQAASSLAAAHARGIVHRDLKPENLYLVRDGEAAAGERTKILDFGIAKVSGDLGGKVQTQASAVMGTPWFMSPEQCRGAGQVDHRADIYALGCMLFYLITGTPPFDGEGSGDILAAHLREPAPPPSSRRPGLPPALDEVVLRCLAKAPDDRYSSMEHLALVLGQLLAGGSNPGATPPAAPRPGLETAVPGLGPTSAAAAHPTTLASAASQLGVSTPSRRRTIGVALAAIAIVGTVIAVAATRGGHRTASPAALELAVALDAAVALPTIDAAPPAAVPATAPAAPATIEIAIDSVPPGAAVVLDGAVLGTTPYRGTLPRSTAEITLVVHRAGYQDATVVATAAAAIARAVTLDRPRVTRPPRRPTGDRDESANPFAD